MIIEWYRELFLFLWKYLGIFGGLVGISVVVSIVCLPLYHVIGRIVGMENALQSVLIPAVAKIKETYSDAADRQSAIERLYARFGYHPIMGVRKVLPLFVAIPFLLLTYHMLSGTSELEGVKWLCFSDLSKPDGLLFGFNLMPFVMTGVNILTVYATPCFNKKDEVQAWVIALFFLVLLYTANTALMIYWTLNQLFNFGRSLCENHFSGAKLLASRIAAIPHYLNPMIYFRVIATRMTTCTNLVKTKISEVTPKGVVFKTVSGFVVTNIFVIFPLVASLAWRTPKDLTISLVDHSAAPSIVVKSEDGVLKSLYRTSSIDGNTRFNEFFSDSTPLDTACYYISAAPKSRVIVDKIRITRFDVLCHDLTAEKLIQAYEVDSGATLSLNENGAVEIRIPSSGSCLLKPKSGIVPGWSCERFQANGRILPSRVWKLIPYAELMLFVFCCICAIFSDNHTNCTERIFLSASSALLVAVFIAVVLPMQTFLLNSADFQFTRTAFAWNVLWVATLIFVFVFVGLWASHFSMGYLLHVVLLSFVVYEFLQTGVLSIGEPSFNGDLDYYRNSGRIIRDLITAAICFSIPIWAYKWIRTHLKCLLLWISVAVVASLLGVHKDQRSGLKVLGSVPKENVAENVMFSTTRNVIVLVLDSISTEVALDCIERRQDFTHAFSEFTLFANNIGCHHGTGHSTAALLTGEFYRGPDDKAQVEKFEATTFTKGVLPAYLNSDWHVHFASGAFNFGFSDCKNTIECKSAPTEIAPLFARTNNGLGFSLFDVLRFRLTPFIAKIPIYKLTDKSIEKRAWSEFEETLYPKIASAPFYSVPANNFLYFHTMGAHVPHCITADGVRTSDFRYGYDAYLDHTVFCFNELAKFLNALKQRGIYDKSFIIVIADHGSHRDGDTRHPDSRPEALKPRAFPLLMVKPFAANGNLIIDGTAPTSHIRLHDLLIALKDKDLSLDDTRKILSVSGERTFIFPLNGCYDEWRVGVDGMIKSYYRK